MNLFYLDLVAKKSARYHCDKHVVKLILEATQMLYSVWHLCEPNETWKTKAPSNYMKLTHKNHPLSIWVRTNDKTYDMVAEYCHSLMEEYTLRYGKIHSSKLHMDFLTNNYPSNLPKGTSLPIMPLCMPDNYKVKPATKWSDVVDSYRAYYIGEKLHFCSYKGVEWPEWLPPRPVTEKKDAKKKTAAIKKESDSKKVSKTPSIKKESTSSTSSSILNNKKINVPSIKKESTSILSKSTKTTTTNSSTLSSTRSMTTTTTTTTTKSSSSSKDYLTIPSLFNPNPLFAPILTRSQSRLKIEK